MSNETPPPSNKSKNYSGWIRLVKLWTKFLDPETTRQRPALIISLDGNALKLDDKTFLTKME